MSREQHSFLRFRSRNRAWRQGASSPHPHGEIRAIDALPTEAAREADHRSRFFAETGSRLLFDYLAAELMADERLIYENDKWVALVPYWAIWPFEAIIIPRRGVAPLHDLPANLESGTVPKGTVPV